MTNKKTIIFQSIESKNFVEALVEEKSKFTGISMMRLIENALIDHFGFKDEKLNEWCRKYCTDTPMISYLKLLTFLKTNDDLFSFYKIVCKHLNLPVEYGYSGQTDSIKDVVDDFLVANSDALNMYPIPLKQIVFMLSEIQRKEESNE